MITPQSVNDTTSTESPVEVVGMSEAATEHVVIDDAAKDRFTHGQCHALAWELAQATGWSVAALIEPECWYSSDLPECASEDVYPGVCGCQIEHLVAVRPDGKMVDINGVHNPGEVPGFEGWAHIPVDEDLWQYVRTWSAGQKPDMEGARPYVAALLAQIGEDADGDEGGEGPAGAAAVRPQGPVFPGGLLAAETARPYTVEDVTTDYDRVSNGEDWVLTTATGETYRLTEVRGEWSVGHMPFRWSTSNGGYHWWAELNEDRGLDAAMDWCRRDAQSKAWAVEMWARYGHMNEERVPWSTELVQTELEPRLWRVERYGRVGIMAKTRWGWEHYPSGRLGEAGTAGVVDGKFRKRAAHKLTVEGLHEIPTDRWVIVGTDAPHGRDAMECGPGSWDEPGLEIGGCHAKTAAGRFVVDILAEDGVSVMGRIGACSFHLARRLAAVHGHVRNPWDVAQKLCGKSTGAWSSRLDWEKRLCQLVAEMLNTGLEGGEFNPRPDAVTELYAEALDIGEVQAGKEARKAAREAGSSTKEQKAAGEAATADRRARRDELVAAAERVEREWEARYRPAPVATADLSLAA